MERGRGAGASRRKQAGAALFALALGTLATPAAAQNQTQTVLLEDVVRAALTQNPQILLENERVRRAEGQLQQAQGAFDWTASAESGWERLYVAEAGNGFLTVDLRELDAWRSTLGVSRQFRNGITIQPGISFYSNTGGVSDGQSLGLTKPRPALNVTVPLLRGFGVDSMAATAERAAIQGLAASEHGRTHAVESAVTNATLVFWRCLALRRQLAIVEADQRSADDYVASIRAFVESGEGEQAALDRALANQAMQNVALSRSQAEDMACRRQLDVAMGGDGRREPVPEGEFPDMENAALAASQLSAASLTDNALMQREDVQALSLQGAAQAERVRGARDAMQPEVTLTLDPRRIMVRLSQSLGRNRQEGMLSEALAGEGEARLNQRQLETQIRLDIAENLRGLQDALLNWRALSEASATMEILADEAERSYQAGFSTLQDTRSVQQESINLRRQVIDAQLQYASYLAALRLSLGSVDTAESLSAEQVAAQFRSLPAH